MPVVAFQRNVMVSPRKAGVVAALVRGRSLDDALIILEHTPRRSAKAVKQAVKSAGANAEHNHNYKPGTLVISEISVTPGVRYKRYRKGRGYRGGMDPFQRKTSNIKVIVDGERRPSKKPAATAKEKP